MPVEKPIDDDPVIRRVAAVRPPVAEDDLSEDGRRARAIVERVLAGSPPIPSSGSRRTRPRWGLPWAGLALAPVAAAIVLFLAGTFAGPDHSGTQPAAAAVTRAALRALAPAGTIFIEDDTYVSGPSVHGHPYTLDQVTETPTGPGPQNALTTTDDPDAFGQRSTVTGWAYVGGEQAFYSKSTNTIYETSIWGPYLHPGPRPGTYVYRNAAGAPTYATHPVNVTAEQRRALLTGRAAIVLTSRQVGDKIKLTGLKVRPPSRAPSYAQTLRDEIRGHSLRFVARTTVDGRVALEFAGTTNGSRSGDEHVYLDPATHLPFEEVDLPGTARQQVIHVTLRKLPITRATERLLSLRALHPTARIDRSFRDYLKAAHGTEIYPE